MGTLLTALLILTLPTASGAVDIPYEKYILPSNGLEVILSEDHALPLVAVNVWYHAGPVNEPPHRTGFAHLFEHLMFQGSKHVGENDHFKLLETRGASMINGTTDEDRTNYFETVPSHELELALWLESDRMGFLQDTLTQAKLDNQRDVVINERRQTLDNAPYGPSNEKLVQILFPVGHPYHGYVIGSLDDLKAATLEDVQEFYTRYYAPANATLAVVGDFNPAQAKRWIDHFFGTLPRRPAPQPRQSAPWPALEKAQRITVYEPVSLPRVHMAWVSPAAYQDGDAQADILASILGQGETSRLYRRLVYERQVAQKVTAQQESLALASVFRITATAKPGVSISKLEAELSRLITQMRSKPPRRKEVERARNALLTRLMVPLQNRGGFGGKADRLNHYNQYVHEPNFLAQDIQRYQAVTPRSVQSLAQKLLDPHRSAVVITLPKP